MYFGRILIIYNFYAICCIFQKPKLPSALDKNIEAKAILEMAGKPQLSEGIRELEEDEAPMTEEMKRQMNTIPKLL